VYPEAAVGFPAHVQLGGQGPPEPSRLDEACYIGLKQNSLAPGWLGQSTANLDQGEVKRTLGEASTDEDGVRSEND